MSRRRDPVKVEAIEGAAERVAVQHDLHHVELGRRQLAKRFRDRRDGFRDAPRSGELALDVLELVALTEAFHQHFLDGGVERRIELARARRLELERPRVPEEHPIERLERCERRLLAAAFQRDVVNESLVQKNMATVRRRFDDEHAGLSRRSEELEQIGEWDLFEAAAHAALAAAFVPERRGGEALRDGAVLEPRCVLGAPSSLAATITFKMLLPMRTRSPSLSQPFTMRSPFTKVPLVEPRSSIWILPSLSSIFACLRDTISSTSTMSRSLERPTTMGWFSSMGNSPPWYFPEMNRRASRDRELPFGGAAGIP